MKLRRNEWNCWHVLRTKQLYVLWICRQWVPQCPAKCRELLKLFAVLWRAPITGDVSISTTSQPNRIRVNSTTTIRAISTSCQTANITTIRQVWRCIKYCNMEILVQLLSADFALTYNYIQDTHILGASRFIFAIAWFSCWILFGYYFLDVGYWIYWYPQLRLM